MQNNKYSTFICVLTNKSGTQDYYRLFNDISNEIGKITKIVPNTNWVAPQQYIDEMGYNLISEIWFLETLTINEIIEIKRWTMYFEYQYSTNGHRKFNLNPGYLSKDGMFLLTHKDNIQRGRMNLDSGIWQEKQYNVIKNIVVPIDNTFSEYLSSDRLEIFNRINKVANFTASNQVLVIKGQTEVLEHL